MTLNDLAGEYLQLLDMLLEDDAEEDVIRDTMEAIQGEIEVKAEAYAVVIGRLQQDVAALDGEMKAVKAEYERLKARKEARENNVDRVKKHLIEGMKAADLPKIKNAFHTIWIQQTPPAVVIDDENNISTKYLIPQPPKVDKDGIKSAIQKGAKLPFAHLETHDSLRIR